MIELDREGAVWILRMAAGENRFNREWLGAVTAALDRVEAADGPGALVTTGAGKFLAEHKRLVYGDAARACLPS